MPADDMQPVQSRPRDQMHTTQVHHQPGQRVQHAPVELLHHLPPLSKHQLHRCAAHPRQLEPQK
jgi:hypothetical protein